MKEEESNFVLTKLEYLCAFIVLFLLFLTGCCFSQQPSVKETPSYASNSKHLRQAGDGFAPSREAESTAAKALPKKNLAESEEPEIRVGPSSREHVISATSSNAKRAEVRELMFGQLSDSEKEIINETANIKMDDLLFKEIMRDDQTVTVMWKVSVTLSAPESHDLKITARFIDKNEKIIKECVPKTMKFDPNKKKPVFDAETLSVSEFNRLKTVGVSAVLVPESKQREYEPKDE